jgi:hypothetical protein
MIGSEERWFQQFPVDSDDRSDLDAIWDDQFAGPKPVRTPTRAEKASIILVGVSAIGFIVLMVVTLLVAVYISRR